MRALRSILVWLLVGVGSAAIAYPALAYSTGALRQSRLSAEIRTLLGPTGSVAPPAPSVSVRALRPAEGQALGVIEIPSIGVDAAFLEGVSDETLLTGPGHLPGTALPGTSDVSVLAAHRDMHFRNLKDLRVGGLVRLRLTTGPVTYRVTHRAIAGPAERWVTVPRKQHVLRLVTCWPPNFIGPAPERLVVSAEPIDRNSAGRVEEGRAEPVDESRAERASTNPVQTVGGLTSPDSIAVASRGGGLVSAASLPPIGATGATAAALAAFGAFRTRRALAWWFLPWMGGLGLTSLVLLAAWAGPRLVSAG
jgi:sortase A